MKIIQTESKLPENRILLDAIELVNKVLHEYNFNYILYHSIMGNVVDSFVEYEKRLKNG